MSMWDVCTNPDIPCSSLHTWVLDVEYGKTPRVLRHTLHSPLLFPYLVPHTGQYKYLTGEGSATLALWMDIVQM